MPGIADNCVESRQNNDPETPSIPETLHLQSSVESSSEVLPVPTCDPISTEVTQQDKLNKRLLESLLNRMKAECGEDNTTANGLGSGRGADTLNSMLKRCTDSDEVDELDDSTLNDDEWK